MKKRKKLFITISVLLVMMIAAVMLFSGCRDTVEMLLPEEIKDGGLTDEEFELVAAGSGNKELTIVEGVGTLVSLGVAKEGSTTYYIDAQNGNDNYDGLSPLTPWRSFRDANKKTFQPGDHILLEANSVWNGTSVNQSNLNTLLNSSEVGMLWPKGSGTYQNHIVIDFYVIEDFVSSNPKMSFRSNTRPIINGNGTPSMGSNRWFPSGAITLWEQHHWRIRNIQVTNTFKDFLAERDTHWYNSMVPKHLSGIFIGGVSDTRTNPDYRQIVNPDDITTYNIIVEHCYVHDVQSMHQNNGKGSEFQGSQALGGGAASPIFKVVGGIIVYGMHYNYDGTSIPGSGNYYGYNGLLLQNNIVKRVGLEGLRNKTTPDTKGLANSNIVFRGNYLEDIFGDGIVVDGVQSSDALNARGNHMNGLVESNVIIRACAAPNSGAANYAAVWAMTCIDTTFQYNEVYGSIYGWNDGEAWDIDIGSNRVIYQYNFSHHNQGGAILFMSGITNGIFRYNISANDGGGTRSLTGVYPGINTSSDSYTRWNNGQCFFHYSFSNATGSNNIPLIYNNTFYVGDGINVGVFGNDTTGKADRYVRFYNNIILKEGDGRVVMSYGQTDNGNTTGSIVNPASGFRNNILWAVDKNGSPRTGAFTNGSSGMTPLLGNIENGSYVGVNGNRWVNPRLQIQTDRTNITRLKEMALTRLPPEGITDPVVLSQFTGRERMRSRASMFSPADNNSPVIAAGMLIPTTAMNNNSEHDSIDRGWNTQFPLTVDLFNHPLDWNTPPIGAAVAPYNGTSSLP